MSAAGEVSELSEGNNCQSQNQIFGGILIESNTTGEPRCLRTYRLVSERAVGVGTWPLDMRVKPTVSNTLNGMDRTSKYKVLARVACDCCFVVQCPVSPTAT